MHRAECARACACLRGHIPGGAPVLRCGTRPESPGPSKEEVSLGCAKVRRLRCYGPVERGAGAPLAGMRPCNRPLACRHRPYACLRGQIPRGAPLPRSDTPCWGFSRNCAARARRRSRFRRPWPGDATRSRSHCTPHECARWDACAVTSPEGSPVPRSGVPSSHPHLAQRASRNLIRASLDHAASRPKRSSRRTNSDKIAR
jgi:hypothetical protein